MYSSSSCGRKFSPKRRRNSSRMRRARRPEPAGLAVRAGAQHALLLHRLGEVLRAPAQSFERAALGIDRAVRVAFSKLTFRLPHGVAGAAELIHLALPLLALAEALLAQLLHQFLELIAQCLLILAQLTHSGAGARHLFEPINHVAQILR